MIRRSEFARVLALVESSGAAARVEQILRTDDAGGRPRQIPFAVFFAAVIMAAQDKGNLSLVRVHQVLTCDLARSYQVALGVITGRGKHQHTLTIRQVRYMLEALNRKLADSDDRAQRREALQRILDLLLDATIPTHLPVSGAYALDGTAIDSWAKGRSRPSVDPGADHAGDADRASTDSNEPATVSFDPDAAWGYRTKTYDNRSNMCFGYHAFALVGVPAVGASPSVAPKLIERLTLRPANANAVEPSLVLIDSLHAAGRPVRELLADREFSYKKDTDWAAQLRERDIAQVLDMHDGDRGIRDYHGIAMIDGAPHCAAVLAGRNDLIRIPRPATLSPGVLKASASAVEQAEHAARVAEIDGFKQKIAARNVAAFRRVAGANANGDERWECPAQAGKVICGNCPLSQGFPADTPVVATPHVVPPLLPEPPKPGPKASAADKRAYRVAKQTWQAQADVLRCCRQRTVTIPASVAGKLRQQHLWGSDAWIASYARRTHVEGAFGNLKSNKTTGITRGSIFVVGIVKTTIMLAAAAVATNIRLLRKWADQTGDHTHPLTAVDPDHHGFEELDANGNPDLALAPPPVA